MNFENFKPTPIVKKLTRSKSSEQLNELDQPVEELQSNEPVVAEVKVVHQRGRKTKYTTDEERLAARKQQQREYRDRKKEELKKLKEKVAELEALLAQH